MRRWGARTLAAAGAWGLLLGYAAISERSMRPAALAAAVVAALAVGWLCADTSVLLGDGPRWQLYRANTTWRTFDPRFARLSQDIAEASDRSAAAGAVHASLLRVTERVLADKYGVDLVRDPIAARLVLGQSLASYLDDGPSKDRDVVSPQVLAALDRLESL